MEWSNNAWKAIEDIYKQTLDLQFLKELMDGSLNKEKFTFYLEQDSLYLADFGKVLAGIACKLDKAEYREAFLAFASDTVAVEQALHQEYLDNKEVEIDPSPTCLLYTSYMHTKMAKESVEVAVAAILPCFWIYKKVGDYILENQSEGNNPYQSWINTYGGEEFSEAVEKAIAICDDLAADSSSSQRKKMTEAFVMASKLEWMFWNSAYTMEKWPMETKLAEV